jgi:murein DD-endopeptidase MepM/ murein hydrolase activator NlpD
MQKKVTWILIIILLVIAAVVALMLFKDFLVQPVIHPKAKEPTVEYGIVTDSMAIERNQIEPGENLASIIGSYNVEPEKLELLGEKAVDVFDLRKVKAGNTYTAMCANTPEKPLLYFIYEASDTNYVVFDFRDSLNIFMKTRDVVKKDRLIAGVITSSLWGAMEDAKADPDLAIALSQIFRWSIDFYTIQKGDEFKVIYEELAVEGKPVGMGQVHFVWLKHAGKEYTAIRFTQNDKTDYFTQNGENLRKEFLKSPLKFTRITSKFSNSRFHPILHIFRPHHGVDYAAPRGTPVHTIGGGLVTRTGYAGGGGNMVAVTHSGGYSTTYMHLSRFGPRIHRGIHVNQGQVIGYVGSTGLATGPHLDFRLYKNGVAINPLRIASPPAQPILKQNLSKFDSVKSMYLKMWIESATQKPGVIFKPLKK